MACNMQGETQKHAIKTKHTCFSISAMRKVSASMAAAQSARCLRSVATIRSRSRTCNNTQSVKCKASYYNTFHRTDSSSSLFWRSCSLLQFFHQLCHFLLTLFRAAACRSCRCWSTSSCSCRTRRARSASARFGGHSSATTALGRLVGTFLRDSATSAFPSTARISGVEESVSRTSVLI